MPELNSILVEHRDGKGIITINRPEVLNAIDWATFYKLQDTVDELIADPEVRIVILTGAGKKAFISGGDINEELSLEGTIAHYRWSQAGHNFCSTLEKSPKPIIAAINGYCLGGGFEFALACDFRICSENAKLGAPESKLGICCGFGGDVRLPRLIGRAKAKEFLMTGNMIDAQEAYRLNLVNKVVAQESLMEEVERFCDSLLNKSSLALEFIKHSVDTSIEMDMDSALRFDSALWGVISGTNDATEGFTAFLEKRDPLWSNS